MPSAHHVKVQMKDGLPAVPARIGDHAESRGSKPLVVRNLGAGQEETAEERLIGLIRILKRSDVTLGNHQRMHRRLGIDIVERQSFFVLVDDRGRNTPFDDTAEYAGAHDRPLLLAGPQPGLSEPLAEFLIHLCHRHVMVPQHHERVEQEIGHFVHDLVFLSPLGGDQDLPGFLCDFL